MEDETKKTRSRMRLPRALRVFLQLTIAAAGMLLASYVGGWLLFVGGMTEVLQLMDAPGPPPPGDVAIATLKLAAATPAGGVLFWSAMGLVMGLWDHGEPESA